MTSVTLTVLQGADRGKIYKGLLPPITIGREEGNSIQLNDERVSRCHLKIQDDNHRLVLTDLDSTNGTKVNGQESHLRILRYGDLITVGRSVLLYGTQEEIAARIASINRKSTEGEPLTSSQDSQGSSNDDFVVNGSPSSATMAIALGMLEPPSLPENLSPSQAAQMCEVLEYIHSRLNRLIEHAELDESEGIVRLTIAQWQSMVDAQVRLGSMLREISDPQ